MSGNGAFVGWDRDCLATRERGRDFGAFNPAPQLALSQGRLKAGNVPANRGNIGNPEAGN
jgi:hypothetical protein